MSAQAEASRLTALRRKAADHEHAATDARIAGDREAAAWHDSMARELWTRVRTQKGTAR